MKKKKKKYTQEQPPHMTMDDVCWWTPMAAVNTGSTAPNSTYIY